MYDHTGNSHPRLADAVAARCVTPLSFSPFYFTSGSISAHPFLARTFFLTASRLLTYLLCLPFTRLPSTHSSPTLRIPTSAPLFRNTHHTQSRNPAYSMSCLQIPLAGDERADPLVDPGRGCFHPTITLSPCYQ